MSISKNWLRLLPSWPLIAAMSLCISPVYAQDDGADYEEEIEEIVTTGSRIKRDTFSTTTPIQVLSTEDAARIGITSISELMQKSTAVSGQKVDASVNANAGQTNASEAPSEGGIGSSCVNLRGLGCERTLVLINGKRLGLAGIRGAPPQPDINLIPIGMVEAVDVLTGGLSTVYGADAVAGVVNVRLKNDFEGVQFTATTELTDEKGGEIYQAGMVAGVGNDSGNITLGMEYSRQLRVTAGDRSFSQCLRRGRRGYSQTMDGTIISQCSSDFPDDWVFHGQDWFASGDLTWSGGDFNTLSASDRNRFLYTPGTTDIGVPNFSTFLILPQNTNPNLGPTFPGPGTDNGYNRFRFLDSIGNDQYDRRIADIWRPFERFSLVSTGHLDPGWGGNSELYFEGYYFNRQNFVIGANEQIFPSLPGTVPIVDTTNATVFFDPATGTSVDAAGTPVSDANGDGLFTNNPMNPFPGTAGTILTNDDMPQTFDVELQQSRAVVGIRGDLFGTESWSYDVAASYDRATGFVKQPILLENNLFFATQTVGVVATQDTCIGANCGATGADGDLRFVLALDTDNGDDDIDGTADDSPTFGQMINSSQPVWTNIPSGQAVCGGVIAADVIGQFTLPDCVPLALFDPAMANDPGVHSGHFATDAERNYLIQNRTNRTVTELSQFMAYITGDLFSIPGGGDVGSAFGIEYREDAITSQNSAAGVLGLNAAENPLQEGETIGERTTFDVYGEISAPVVVDAPWASLLQLDAALRFTDDENFGEETVWKVGALWDINEWVSLNASFNTSFRAPNLREQFLADQAGALPGNSDPCHSVGFNMLLDGTEKEQLRANCLLSGVDPEILGTAFTVAIPTSVGGAAGLLPETSESFTTTITLRQPWSDRFDFDIAVTYFDIQIEDTVRALDAGTIVNRCYFDQPGLTSPFCTRVERIRPTAPPDGNFISFVRAGFVNTGEESVTGFDITTRLNMDIGGASINWATGSTLLSERLSQEFPPSEALPNGSAIVDNVGRIGNPEATFQSTLVVTTGDWDVVWQARWWDDTEFPQGRANPVITDPDGLIISGGPVGQDPADVFDEFTEFQFLQDALVNPAVGPTRLVTAADGQWHHDLSLTYSLENATVTAGINNVTNEEPPLISTGAGPQRNNAVTSARYDVVGRSYFVRVVFGF